MLRRYTSDEPTNRCRSCPYSEERVILGDSGSEEGGNEVEWAEQSYH